ncbi:MAG: HlyC/CorC family transporter [Deltaproteobacteria bacterium]|nr:HlyC/CorC family transporter [Deltaproteobacteria bacterium]
MTDFFIILLLILANGLFAGAEIAIVALRRSRLEELVDEGRVAARAVLTLREKPERFLATVQIGITVVGATAAAYGGSSIASGLAQRLGTYALISKHAEPIAFATVVTVISGLSIVLGELVPKSLALRHAEPYALFAGRFVLALCQLARPLVWLLTTLSNIVLRPFGDSTTFTEARHSAEEIQQVVEEATKAGTIHPQAGEIASRALDFPDLSVGDVMVPRPSVAMLSKTATPDEIRAILREHTHARLPVYEGSRDNVVGYVSLKDLLLQAWSDSSSLIEKSLRPAHFVPESKLAVDLLDEMRRQRIPFAIVVDEQGSLAGLVTIEDLIEEFVGEIFDEHVRRVPEVITKEANGAVRVSGSAPVREVNRALELELPEEGTFTTIAGLCLTLAGRIPSEGEKFPLPSGVVLEVVEATQRGIRAVRIHPPPATSGPA